MSHDIPYVIVRGTELFERKVIKDLSAFCTLIVNPKDNVAFARIFTLIPGHGKVSFAPPASLIVFFAFWCVLVRLVGFGGVWWGLVGFGGVWWGLVSEFVCLVAAVVDQISPI